MKVWYGTLPLEGVLVLASRHNVFVRDMFRGKGRRPTSPRPIQHHHARVDQSSYHHHETPSGPNANTKFPWTADDGAQG
eukprot:scaffold134_cov94-Amphora_coffeaeformis.AAC.3